MMLYAMTVPYRAERIKTADEQRRADEQLGMMAAEVSRLWRHVIRPALQRSPGANPASCSSSPRAAGEPR